MENELNSISKEIAGIIEKISALQSSGKIIHKKVLALVEAQLKNVYSTLEIVEELEEENTMETIAVAEETIPVDIKEVVEMSLENTALETVEVVKQAEAVPVAEKKSKPVKAEKTDNSLVEKMKRKPIKDLRTAIGINEKFAFIKLFGGDANAWGNALQKLNSFSSYWEAEAMLSEFSQKYKWKDEDETLQSLMDLVERRYM